MNTSLWNRHELQKKNNTLELSIAILLREDEKKRNGRSYEVQIQNHEEQTCTSTERQNSGKGLDKVTTVFRKQKLLQQTDHSNI